MTPTSDSYIIRESAGRRAILVETLARPDARDLVGPAEIYPTERRTEYTAHRGLLCRVWNLADGTGDHHEEVCSGLRHTGGPIPADSGTDIAALVQREVRGRYGSVPILALSPLAPGVA